MPASLDNKVTVTIPVYGQWDRLAGAVESILSQTHTDLTLVIANDGDPDPPWDVIAHIRDPRIVRFDLHRNRGRYFADAVVLKATPDPFYLIQDADDWSEPTRIERLLGRLVRDQADAAVSAYFEHVPMEGLPERTRIKRYPGFGRPLSHNLRHRACHAGLYRCTALREIGGYYGGFRAAYDTLLIGLLMMTCKLVYVDEPLYHVVHTPGSLTRGSRTALGSRRRNVIKRHLQATYEEALQARADLDAGLLGRGAFLRKIRRAALTHVTRSERQAITRNARGLSDLLNKSATGTRRAAPARRKRPTGSDASFQTTHSIAHLVRGYLPNSENFIHGLIHHGSRYSYQVLTDVTSNLDTFPAHACYLITREEADELVRNQGVGALASFLHELNYPNCFARHIREAGFQALHAHFGDLGWHSLGLKQRLGLPLITSFYGFDASKLPQQPEWTKRLRHLFQVGDVFLVLGSDMARRLEELGCPEDRIRIHHLGVDLDRIRFRPRGQTSRGGAVSILFVGRLVEKKGVPLLVEAFGHIAPRRKNVTLTIVGDGPQSNEVKSKVLDLGLRGRVSMVGDLSNADVLEQIDRADLLVHPCRTASDGDMEGTPVVLMEAQAAGLPVVSTRHADTPDVVRDGESGFLVPEDDVNALVGALDRLLRERGRWPEMGKAGRAHIDAHFNVRHQAAALEELYDECASATGA